MIIWMQKLELYKFQEGMASLDNKFKKQSKIIDESFINQKNYF